MVGTLGDCPAVGIWPDGECMAQWGMLARSARCGHELGGLSRVIHPGCGLHSGRQELRGETTASVGPLRPSRYFL